MTDNITVNIDATEPEIAVTLDELRYLVFRGMTGDSAYDEAVKLGFEGTEAEWLASLKGDPGADGHSPFINTSGYWVFWNDSTGAWVTTNYKAAGTPGADGHSPFINQNGYWVFWNYQTNTWRVSNLKAEGTPGADGVSPIVEVTEITRGHRVKITDAEHPSGQTFDVMDGQDGNSDDVVYLEYDSMFDDDPSITIDSSDPNYTTAATIAAGIVNDEIRDVRFTDVYTSEVYRLVDYSNATPASLTFACVKNNVVKFAAMTGTSGKPTYTSVSISGGSANAVLYTPQTLTDAQQEQARSNIGIEFLNATDADDMWDDADADIPGTETFGTVSKITNKLLIKESNNLSRSDADWKDGYRVRNVAGDEVASPGISCSKMIPVEPGDVIRLFDLSGGTFGEREMRAVATFAADGTVVPNPDATGWKVRAYTVAEGVRYVRVSAPTASNYMVTKNYAPTAFEPWFEPYYVATDDFIRDAVGDVKTTDLSNQIAFALPQSAFRQTVGLPQTWYKRSMVSPVTEQVYVRGGEAGTTDDADKVTFANASAKNSANGYLWYAYDPFFNLLKKFDAGTGYGASAKVVAENLRDCTVLVIGDSTVDSDDMTGSLLSYFTQKGKTVTLLGTLFKSSAPLNRNEGRAGWSTADYTTDSTVSGYTNPFYNPAAGAFDFSYYMAQQGYSGADFVVLQLGINDLYPSSPKNTTEPDYAAIWGNLKTMIDSILAYDSTIKILVNLPTAPNSDPTKHGICEFLYRHWVVRYNEYALAQIKAQYSRNSVRASYCHLILDPATDIRDNVHPTAAGYEKMALELVNQINCWQNDT